MARYGCITGMARYESWNQSSELDGENVIIISTKDLASLFIVALISYILHYAFRECIMTQI